MVDFAYPIHRALLPICVSSSLSLHAFLIPNLQLGWNGHWLLSSFSRSKDEYASVERVHSLSVEHLPEGKGTPVLPLPTCKSRP